MKELLKFIIENIVEEPEKVVIEEIEDPTSKVFEIDAAEEDKGRIIGKGGKTIKSIRSLVSIKAKKEGTRVYIKVL